MGKSTKELIEVLMADSNISHSNAEKIVSIFEELFGGSTIPTQRPKSRSKKKPNYTEENYPHYLPAAQVWKYTLRITLRGIKPAIWRKIEVPSNITLRHLGDLIIYLMGWCNGHCNQYRKNNEYHVPFYQREPDDEDSMFFNYTIYNQEDYTIADILTKKGSTHTLEYDFGDSWLHEIRLSSISEYAEGEPRQIVFVGGKRACPPEDCGGTWGYEELLDIVRKRQSHKRLTAYEKDMLEGYDISPDFDPDYLDLDYCEEIVDDFNT